ncbi:MAG: Asp23/Gls24 family envelope stress response protein [Lachnospiraceae bacterium]|nr:Asp23/Gls24 family envelope stress response protein [Lachnospiraceae bacterium]
MDEKLQYETIEGVENDDIVSVRISDDAVAMVTAIATLEVEGVHCLSGGATADALYKLSAKKLKNSIKVEVQDNAVRISILLVIKYGYNIPAVCSQVQTRVQTSVENMTGLKVEDINIRITGVEMV